MANTFNISGQCSFFLHWIQSSHLDFLSIQCITLHVLLQFSHHHSHGKHLCHFWSTFFFFPPLDSINRTHPNNRIQNDVISYQFMNRLGACGGCMVVYGWNHKTELWSCELHRKGVGGVGIFLSSDSWSPGRLPSTRTAVHTHATKTHEFYPRFPQGCPSLNSRHKHICTLHSDRSIPLKC